MQLNMALLTLLRNVGKPDASLVVGCQGCSSLNLTMQAIHVASHLWAYK